LKGNKLGKALAGIVILVLLGYFASGIYSLRSGQHALILRFGKVVDEVTASGINYHLPAPFEKAFKVHVRQVQKVQIQQQRGGGVEGFTGDENLLLIRAAVNYDVKNLTHYLLNVEEAKSVIESAGRMCLSAELTKMKVDDVMTVGKSVMRLVLKERIQETLDSLKLGVRVISVELTDIAPPKNVSMAFKAVSDAREKKQRIIKESEGYANSTIPKARGEAISIVYQAAAYASETLNLAQARVEAFKALKKEYANNPDITAKQRYLETLQRIYQKCKVMIDGSPSQSTYYIGKGEIIRKGD